ncbi:hypothetical protein [Xenorhabdus indica]|uniref:hypothetical protein n=1 Tax=Xenorhabdus indica TaxID=333964 RepID=UPI001CA3E403|nr:hypothetical protein [Xenorhabdus indica]MBC8946780.1 tail fiber protein [Xenorhabdus indica]
MQKIGDITNTADSNGEFTNGNVAAGIPPTKLEAPWFTTVQREMINVLLKAGMNPDKTNDAQLSEAIKKMVSDSQVALTDSFGQSSTLAASQKLATHANDNANRRLDKAQNGADIPDKGAFVDNLGLRDTVNQAQNAYPKTGGVINGNVDVTGNVSGNGIYEAGGVRVYSPNNPPTEALLETNGWYRDTVNGVIIQWGNGIYSDGQLVKFPRPFSPISVFGDDKCEP